MPRALIVDDNPENLYLLAALLAGNGYAVDKAGNGIEALASAKANAPDLVISDILMPGMDGFALCRQWKQDPGLQRIPFVFYTATYTDLQDEKFALDLGADLFLVKPQEPEEFIHKITRMLKRHEAGHLLCPPAAAMEESSYLREYNDSLIHKLEDKLVELEHAIRVKEALAAQLEGANAELRAKIAWRKTAEESLRKLFQAVEQSPVNVVITDLNGNIEYANPKFCQRTGYTLAEAQGKNLRILKSGHTSDEEYRTLWRTITAGGQWSGEFLNKAKDGSLFWERAVISSIKDEAGRITHYLAVKEDITQQKKAEETLQQMRAQLAHVARLSTLGEMAAELTHELNHPLYAILNYAKASRNVLADEGPPDIESLCEWNEEIAEIALSAAEVVNRLRSFARRAESPRTACRIQQIVEEALGLVAVELRRARTAVETSFPASPPAVHVDRVQIQQVLVNLLSNAIEAMESLPPEKRRITVRASVEDAQIEVTVTDCGAGLPPGGEAEIFEPFVSTKPNGLGMGLSIASTIVEAHGGRLWAAPNPAGGAAFHFTLPLAEAARGDGV